MIKYKKALIFVAKDIGWIVVSEVYMDRVNKMMEDLEGQADQEEIMEILKEKEIPFVFIKGKERGMEVTKFPET